MKRRFLLPLLFAALYAGSVHAALESKTVRYELGGSTFESTIVYDTAAAQPQPGVLMVPNWMGPTANAMTKARMVAANGYVVMVTDMYGVDVRPANGSEAGAAAGFVRGDRALMRARAAKGLDVLLSNAKAVNLDKSKLAAIGFCFGGGTVLELGRSGAKLDAIVSFHGDLVSPTLEADAAKTKAKVLVLHGAADPYVPQTDVAQFTTAMLATDVDWQLVEFSGTVHSFTNPDAAAAGQSEYNALSSARAFTMMNALFTEIWR
ncbi:dienelactone hydrolase family protein [Synoicihabitans lomoniglobus]|uniref:Dienelactone hydrolase family protein n=1 Tax=Synoicihabitans lomoniglobus TaxID=2909285 RepID=A0AAF0CHZ8_9BACT|nr:dienelactone hydrolase family protein [Opitutaceae bacterium LMO-M01]WED64832.1 dienelactone hydrolase family protein [Opitutaceae bacterium LMO-M01]